LERSSFILRLVIAVFGCAACVAPQGCADSFDSNGVPIHYTVDGEGPPVVLVHGFAVNSALNWRLMGVIDALSEAFQVIAMDCRGHGCSGKPHAPELYGVEMAEDVIRLMDHLSIEKAHLAGYSMGGAIALTLAVTRPARFWSVAGCGSGWYKAGTRDTDIVVRAIRAKEAARKERARAHSAEGMKRILSADIPDLFEQAINDQEALKAVGERFHELCMTEAAVRANTVPYLCILGSRDGRMASAQLLAEVMPHVELVVIPGGVHNWTPRDPRFSAALIRFFEEHAPK